MNIIIQNQNKFGHLYSLQAVHLPVYRGLNPNGFKYSDYEPQSIGYWPQFTSTTKNMNTAKGFSRQSQKRDSFKGVFLIFKIYLCSPMYNQIQSNIDMIGENWTFFPTEEEVNLLPFFHFQVINSESKKLGTYMEDEDGNKYEHELQTITIAEIPYQNALKKREVSYLSVVWYDQNIRTDAQSRDLKQRFEHYSRKVCVTEQEVLKAITQSVKAVVIMSGRDAAVLVPKICKDKDGRGLNHLTNIYGIIIFCQNVEAHKQWSAKYPVVKLVSKARDQVFDEVERLLQHASGQGMTDPSK